MGTENAIGGVWVHAGKKLSTYTHALKKNKLKRKRKMQKKEEEDHEKDKNEKRGNLREEKGEGTVKEAKEGESVSQLRYSLFLWSRLE